MRKIAILLTVAVVASTAGCGFITGDEPLSFSADPATVNEETLSETGYEEASTRTQNVSREFTVAGETREVTVSNELATYDRAIELGALGEQRAALFATFSSPEVEIATRTFNPISEMSNRQLLSRFSSEYEGLTVGEQVGNESRTVLGTETSIEKYEGTAELDGRTVDVYIHVTTVQHGGDYVVGLGVYPQRLSGEEDRVFTMYDGIEHAE